MERASWVDIAQIHRRLALVQPFGERPADPAGGLHTDGVEAAGHEKAGQTGGRPKIVTVVWGETLGAVEKSPNAGIGQDRQALHRAFQ